MEFGDAIGEGAYAPQLEIMFSLDEDQEGRKKPAVFKEIY
jgi:hypothetical protein